MGYLQFKLNFWVTLIAWNLRFTLIEDKLIFWGDSLTELPCLRIHLFEDRFEFYFVWGQICLGIDLIFTLFEDNLSPASLHAQPPLCKVPSLGKVEHSDVSGCFLCYLLQWPSKGEAGRNKNADCEKCPKHFRLKICASKVFSTHCVGGNEHWRSCCRLLSGCILKCVWPLVLRKWKHNAWTSQFS